MGLRGDYTDLATLKAHLRITDSTDDAALGVAISAASRAVDEYCNRQFGVADAPVAMVFTGSASPMLPIEDLMDTTGLVVKSASQADGAYDQTWTIGTDFDLWPYNANLYGEPWTAIVPRRSGTYTLPRWTNGVQVTAKWGWTSVPEVVEQAVLIQAARFFVRRNSPYGIAGSPDTGSELRLLAALDPDVQAMLSTVKRWWGAVRG